MQNTFANYVVAELKDIAPEDMTTAEAHILAKAHGILNAPEPVGTWRPVETSDLAADRVW